MGLSIQGGTVVPVTTTTPVVAVIGPPGPAATNPVTSVAGRIGDVTLAEGDIANLTSDLGAKAPTSYVDSQDAATLTSANSHADTGDTATLATATGRAIAFAIALGG